MSQLQMVWPENRLFTPPQASCPAGYRLRNWQPGDNPGYLRLMQQAGFEKWDEERLRQVLNKQLPNGVFFVEHLASGALAATTSALYAAHPDHPGGAELGWVAADPGHQGKGLGVIVCAAVTRCLVQAGFRDIFLLTDDFRLPAIKTYLRLGWRPFLAQPDMQARWLDAMAKLSLEPAGIEMISAGAAAATPGSGRGNLDCLERYPQRNTWNRCREFRGDGVLDALGDEHLYHGAALGRIEVEPTRVQAGSRAGIVIRFTAGKEPPREGDQVLLKIKGQGALGAHDPDLDTAKIFTLIRKPASVEVEMLGLGFGITAGKLLEGDVVELKMAPLNWTKLAGRKELKTIVRRPGFPERRLPEPVVITVEPEAFQQLEALARPGRSGEGEMQLRISARDRFDNRVDRGDTVEIRLGAIRRRVRLHHGLAAVELPVAAGTAAARARVGGNGISAVSNPVVPAQDGLRLCFGDLHCHDFLSEAECHPDQVYAWARDEKNLDFVSVSQQVHGWLDDRTWTIVKLMNERFLDEGSFVTLLAFEWQHSGYGDKIIHYLNGDQPYLPALHPSGYAYDTPGKLYSALAGSDAIVISHHPSYPAGSWCSSTDFDAVDSRFERLVELWSMHGSSEGYDPAVMPMRRGQDPERTVMSALRRGLRLGFSGGSDTHSGRPGGSAKEPGPHWGGITGVWAEALTRRGLFQALWQRRTYALTKARIALKFMVNGAWMGSELPAATESNILLDCQAPGKIAKIEIMRDTAVCQVLKPGKDACRIEWSDSPATAAQPRFYHCRITLDDGNLAVASPVWIG